MKKSGYNMQGQILLGVIITGTIKFRGSDNLTAYEASVLINLPVRINIAFEPPNYLLLAGLRDSILFSGMLKGMNEVRRRKMVSGPSFFLWYLKSITPYPGTRQGE